MTYTSSTVRVPDVAAVPRHIAIIMDGNGRWATQRRLPRVAGHTRGVDAVRAAVEACARQGVEYLTLFAFSSENWRRPNDEVSFLMRLFVTALEREIGKLHANGIRLRVVGDLSRFDTRIRDLIKRAESKTARNTRLTLTIAANYGGRWDIMQATRKLAEQSALAGKAVEVNEDSFAEHLSMAYAPEPDLFIRTGGERRVSNFLLWQLAYTEFYFTDTFWPDFDADALGHAIASYAERERRFGRTSAQLEPQSQNVDSLPMLKTRVITAIILLAVFLPVTLFAPVGAFGALIAFVVVFAAWEWARLLKLGGAGPVVYALLAAVALVASTRLGTGIAEARSLFKAAAIFWLVAGPFVLLRKPTLAQGAWRTFLFLAGIVVFVACWHALVAARMQGVPFVLSLLLLVWLADIGAYFSGKAFGKHKLAPAISPGKTWEGAIGGWLVVMLVAAAAVFLHAFEPTLYSSLLAQWGAVRTLLALTLLVAFSVVGDLFESMMKRQAGVKDSSGLLPGHGGVLDRIDALLPVLPLAMLLLG